MTGRVDDVDFGWWLCTTGHQSRLTWNRDTGTFYVFHPKAAPPTPSEAELMNDRQLHALTHPLSLYPGETADHYRRIHQRGDGSLVVVILAVDR